LINKTTQGEEVCEYLSTSSYTDTEADIFKETESSTLPSISFTYTDGSICPNDANNKMSLQIEVICDTNVKDTFPPAVLQSNIQDCN
jgi:hypothetical protein